MGKSPNELSIVLTMFQASDHFLLIFQHVVVVIHVILKWRIRRRSPQSSHACVEANDRPFVTGPALLKPVEGNNASVLCRQVAVVKRYHY